MTVNSDNVTEYFAFTIGTITGSLHTKWPKCAINNRSAVDRRNVDSFSSATGVIRSIEASGERVMKELEMWVLYASGVERGLR